MRSFVYETTNRINGMTYTGSTCNNLLGGSDYIGSGRALAEAIDKYGRENFTIKILAVCRNRREAYKLEAKIVGDSWKCKSNYNLRKPAIVSSETDRNVSRKKNDKIFKKNSSCSWNSKPVEIDGLIFKSLVDASKYYSVTPECISKWVKAGVKLSDCDVRIGKRVFPSILAASKYYGVSVETIIKWLGNGKYGIVRRLETV